MSARDTEGLWFCYRDQCVYKRMPVQLTVFGKRASSEVPAPDGGANLSLDSSEKLTAGRV